MTTDDHTGDDHTADDRTADDGAITVLYARMCAAWTAADAPAFGACFTEDCDYVSFDGTRARGRAEVVSSHDKLFHGVLHGSRLVGEVETVRHLDDDVAMVHATGSVVVAWRRTPPRRRLTRNSITAVRTPQGWRFAAIHNGRIRPLTVPEPDSVPARMARGMVRAAGALHLGPDRPHRGS